MKNLKSVGLSFTLIAVLFTVAAGDTPVPPCAPGQIPTDPCVSAPANGPDNSANPGQADTPPASVDVIAIAEAALWSLPLSLF
jgi:hypothetical protein